MTHTASAPTRPNTENKFRPVQWLLRLEDAYRQHSQLKSADDHALQDMGITRAQANASFYRQFGQIR